MRTTGASATMLVFVLAVLRRRLSNSLPFFLLGAKRANFFKKGRKCDRISPGYQKSSKELKGQPVRLPSPYGDATRTAAAKLIAPVIFIAVGYLRFRLS
jgi:hypothetical protein